MKRTRITLAAIMLCGLGTAQAETVAPENVVWMDGAIEQSLTGVPGNAVEGGAKVVSTKSLGNCIACHEITDLADVPFHGEVGPLLDGGAGDRWTEAELRGLLADAKMVFDGTVMPSFYKTTGGFTRLGKAYTGKAHEGEVQPLLTAQQIEDVVAYLMTLK